MAGSDAPDRRLVGLALAVGALVVAGQVLADLAGRETSHGVELALDAAAALVPALTALALSFRPQIPWLRVTTLVLAVAGLVVAATGIDDRPSAAALAASPVLVLVACRPRLQTALPQWRGLGGGLLALLVAAGLLITPREGPASSSALLLSGRLDDAQDAIGQADARFLQDTLTETDHVPGARCYFVHEAEGGYADVIACGPVIHPTEVVDIGADPNAAPIVGVWDVYPVRVAGGDLVLSDPTIGQEIDLVLLTRPDGLRPPEVGGRQPLTATVDPGYAAPLGYDGPEDPDPAGGYLLVGTGRVTIEAVAHPTTILDGDGIERSARDGYRLVAFDLTFEEVEGTTLEVVSGGNRVDVTPVVSENTEFYQDGWVVAAAVDDGVAPVLEATYRGRSQRLSLESGERLGGHPLLYEAVSLAPGLVVPEATVPVTVPIPVPHPEEVMIDGYTVARADLTVFDPNLAWAPPGQAWVVVTIEELGPPSFFDIEVFDIDRDTVLRFDPLRSFELQPAEGEAVAPTGANPTNDGDMTIVFAVHDLDRTFVFRSAPQWRIVLGDDVEFAVVAPGIEHTLSFEAP